ncbi:MAG: hypothetical protein BYD32DRAFT_466517 [Podila humilis]|nr:MAG: hypothetical protein BYD32DRAFT_466517 [Podila humilis]
MASPMIRAASAFPVPTFTTPPLPAFPTSNPVLFPVANTNWVALTWISDLTDSEQKLVFGAGVAVLVLALALPLWCVCLIRWRSRLVKQAAAIAAQVSRTAITHAATTDARLAFTPPGTLKVTLAREFGLDSEGGRGGGGSSGGIENCQHTFRFADTSKVVVEAGERFVIVRMKKKNFDQARLEVSQSQFCPTNKNSIHNLQRAVITKGVSL